MRAGLFLRGRHSGCGAAVQRPAARLEGAASSHGRSALTRRWPPRPLSRAQVRGAPLLVSTCSAEAGAGWLPGWSALPCAACRTAASRRATEHQDLLTSDAPAARPAARWRQPAAWQRALPRSVGCQLAGRRRRRRRCRRLPPLSSAAAWAPWAAGRWCLIAVGVRRERLRCLRARQRAAEGQLPPGVRRAWIAGPAGEWVICAKQQRSHRAGGGGQQGTARSMRRR